MGEVPPVRDHYYRVEWLLDELRLSLAASESGNRLADLVAQNLSSTLAQTTALIEVLSTQTTALTEALDALLVSNEELKSSYSETLVLTTDTVGQRIIKPAAIPPEYSTFQLISLDINYTCDATVADRYLVLERVVPDVPANNKLRLLHGDRMLGGGWQNGTMTANNQREQTWCQDANSDNYSRTPIPLLSLNNAFGQSWRLRSIDVPGAGDTCFGVWTFRVFK